VRPAPQSARAASAALNSWPPGYNPFEGKPSSGQYDGGYRRRNAEAWTEFYGMPYREPENPIADAQHSTLACVAAERLAAVSVAQRAFTLYFVKGHGPLDAVGLVHGGVPAASTASISSRRSVIL